MGTSVPRALISTLLIAGVFYAPFAPQAYADEATTTPEVFTESVATSTTATSSSQASQDVSSTTPPQQTSHEVEASSTPSIPLPTGVLLDNSYSDIPWNIQVYDGTGYPGHYTYYFTGVAKVANPPVLSPETAWISTGTTTTVRVKRISGSTCSDWVYGGTAGLTVLGPDFTSYEAEARWTHASGDFCDFQLYGEGIPPGTPLSGMVLGTTAATILTGSHASPGVSLNGLNEDPVPGGFAFQLCGISGCSGGFGTSTPTATTTASTTPRVSNVLFLPGIKGSRLYKDTNICDKEPAPCSFKLWESYGDGAARNLLLDTDGQSIDDVYVKEGDIIDEVVGKKFYASFLEDLRTKDAADTYGSEWRWKAAAYDWRLSLHDIINRGSQHGDKIYYDEATSTPYIEQTLRELAANSPTGKVTIVAHSNGGLVTKALLQKLGDTETSQLVDKIIFIGVPQTGAPQALGALLFGYGESLPGTPVLNDIFMTKQLSRQLAENSPMAYHLMPSQKYLNDTQDPTHSIIGFSGNHLYQKEQEMYGPTIDSLGELHSFLIAQEGGREKPNYTDLTVANILNAGLISYANNLHTSIDTWVPPSSVELYQIAGWGVDTVSGIDFYDEQKILGINIGYKKQYRPVFVEDGDGVVPVPSALASQESANISNYWVNLSDSGKEHGSFFELPGVRQFIEHLLTNNSTLPLSFSRTQPASKGEKKLIFQLHSPLTLGVYDEAGNYEGLNTDGSVSEGIPAITYGEFGDVKYLIIPAGINYQIVMRGMDEGIFSLDIQELTSTSTITTTISNVPTTRNTTARLSITSQGGTSDLQVDTNNDGNDDFNIILELGETKMYRSPVPDSTTEAESTTHNSSMIVSQFNFGTAFKEQIPTPYPVLNQFKQTHPARPIKADKISTEAKSTNQGINSVEDGSKSQTASVYNAWSPIVFWLKSLMYNTWKALLRMVDYKLN